MYFQKQKGEERQHVSPLLLLYHKHDQSKTCDKCITRVLNSRHFTTHVFKIVQTKTASVHSEDKQKQHFFLLYSPQKIFITPTIKIPNKLVCFPIKTIHVLVPVVPFKYVKHKTNSCKVFKTTLQNKTKVMTAVRETCIFI